MHSSEQTPVVVRDRLTSPHPLVAATQKAAIGMKPDETGRLNLGRGGAVKVKISRAALPRALRLLDALCKGAEERGWTVESGTRHSGNANTSVRHGAYSVEFTLSEQTTREAHVRTKSEEALVARGRGYGIPQWDYEATGRLLLRLDHYLAKRSNYSDGVRQRLDDRLDDVLDEVGRIFDAEHERHVERERREQEEVRQRVVAVEAAYQQLIEDRRRDAVESQVSQWRLAHDLRRYSNEVRLLVPEMAPQEGEEAQQWLAWVETYLGEELEPEIAAPALPPDPERRDTSIAPLIAGRGGNQAWLNWISSTG